MSWYGTHPRFSKHDIRAHLPPATCKKCVYWFRCVLGTSPNSWHQQYIHCPRCGISQWEMLAHLNHKLLGISTPSVPADDARPAPKSSVNSAAITASNSAWIRLYQSEKLDIRRRAARALIERVDTPTEVLLHILDTLSHDGLGAAVERALRQRSSPELLDLLLGRLTSPDDFIREAACNILGQTGDSRATLHLLNMLDDRHLMVRCAAAFALSHLKDQSALPELKRQFAARQNDDVNVVWALQSALKSLGVDAEFDS